jgi:hypothetical protein
VSGRIAVPALPRKSSAAATAGRPPKPTMRVVLPSTFDAAAQLAQRVAA